MRVRPTPTQRSSLWQILKSPSMVMFGVSFVILMINVAYIGKIRPFDSDDVYWQQALRTWRPFGGHTFYMGTKDTFVGEVPFLYVMEHLFTSSRKLLIAEAGILTGITFAAFYWSGIYFLKKLKVKLTYQTLLPFAWLASFGFPLVENYLNIDWRTFELGYSFLTFVAFAAILHKEVNILGSIKAKILTILALGFQGILIYSDPYYLYFTFGPVILFLILLYLLKKVDWRQAGTIVGLSLLSIIAAKAAGVVCTKAGIVITGITPSAFMSVDNTVSNTVTSIHGMLIAYGADFSNRPSIGKATTIVLLNFFLVCLIAYKLFAYRKLAQRPSILKLDLSQLWLLFFGGLILFVFIIYTSSTLVDLNNYRYLLTAIYASIIFLAAAIGMSANREFKLFVSTVLIIVTIGNMGQTLFTNTIKEQAIDQPIHNDIGNALNFSVIQAVESHGLTKGYANYWQANVNSYFAKGKVSFLPALCAPNGYATDYHWLVDGSRFNTPANRSFFLYDPEITDPATCTLKQLKYQFGQPVQTIQIGDKSILIYNYDISTKLHPEARAY